MSDLSACVKCYTFSENKLFVTLHTQLHNYKVCPNLIQKERKNYENGFFVKFIDSSTHIFFFKKIVIRKYTFIENR